MHHNSVFLTLSPWELFVRSFSFISLCLASRIFSRRVSRSNIWSMKIQVLFTFCTQSPKVEQIGLRQSDNNSV